MNKHMKRQMQLWKQGLARRPPLSFYKDWTYESWLLGYDDSGYVEYYTFDVDGSGKFRKPEDIGVISQYEQGSFGQTKGCNAICMIRTIMPVGATRRCERVYYHRGKETMRTITLEELCATWHPIFRDYEAEWIAYKWLYR